MSDDNIMTWLTLENGRTMTPTIRSATASETTNLLVVVERSLLCVKTAAMTITLPTITNRLTATSANTGRTNSSDDIPAESFHLPSKRTHTQCPAAMLRWSNPKRDLIKIVTESLTAI